MKTTRHGRKLSEGARILLEKIKKNAWSLAFCAETVRKASATLKVSRSCVHYWVTGNRVPSIESATAIRMALGIPVSAWGKPPREGKLPRKAAA